MGEEMRAVVTVPVATLSSGRTIPLLGMGTASYPFAGSEGVKSAILNAIKLGYRHFDTAALYMSEESLGDAIAEALQLGLIKSREEVFITSKLWCSDAHPDRVLIALRNTLKNLRMEYLDLYLIHWPARLANPGTYVFPPPKEELLPLDYKNVWAAMEECQKLGLTKSIGVSNFSCVKLQNVLTIANIPPAVNQVEMNPIWQQKKLIKFCKANDILVTAYSPLGANGTPWGSSGVAETQVLHEIAKARGKTHAQVCLKWIYQQGVSVLVKSYNVQRMEENLTLFDDWELNEDELKIISEIPQRRGLPGDIFVSEANGPFKSVEELWDGEV